MFRAVHHAHDRVLMCKQQTRGQHKIVFEILTLDAKMSNLQLDVFVDLC